MTDEHSYVPNMTGMLMTADELLQTHIPDKQVELVRGVLVAREPPGFVHGDVAMRLAVRLANHADRQSLGRVLAAETGSQLQSNPDTVRAADVAFLSTERVPDPRPRLHRFSIDALVEMLARASVKVHFTTERGTRVA